MSEEINSNTGNAYVSAEIKNKWPNYEFVGKPFILKNGNTCMRAKSKAFDGATHFYEFETDFFWFDRPN